MTTDWKDAESAAGLEIAIIGLSGRFPGAENIDQFWRNLRDGVESIRQFTDEELISFGVSPAALRDPSFVKSGAILENIDQFDAPFFGYSPREAEILDPQQRIFLECAWQALEDAGYSSDTHRHLVGVFAGTSLSTYLLYHLLTSEEASQDAFQTMIANDKDFLSTRVSYELNLKGPSIDIQTACSTSLVAVHMACQSLNSYQCDIALAGGVSVQVPQRTGYHYIPEGLGSPDGHCRAFDARARGTVFGSGVGIVVLKRLADALSDGDPIHAVIKGSALSNDGSSKIGYTAPSIDGQVQAIAMAQAVAGVEAETITYIETHGTGTVLGDPVEIAALTRVFRASTEKSGFCAIGSAKSNLGHLDAAAGVAGLIKTVLALKHRQLPPSLHFEKPNPQIDFAGSPFYVNSRLQEWKSAGRRLRAGVSSFGVGGTNAHVILEEAPASEPGSRSRASQLLVVSARSRTALETASRNLAQHLREHPESDLSDVTYTLQTGRRRMNHRRILVCRDVPDAARSLESKDPERVLTVHEEAEGRSVVFMFPGGGAQYVNMGLGLYRTEGPFRREVDRCCEILRSGLEFDLRDYLYPESVPVEEARRQMTRTSIGLPALFVVEYAMAMLLEGWGIHPQAMIGHSLGEYVAACLAGVFSLEDALKIVRLRGALFEELPKGAMVSVAAEEEQVRRLIGEELSIAAVNGPELVVVSGEDQSIAELCGRMARAGIEHQRVHIDVAAHSWLVDGILDRYEEYVKGLDKKEPLRRYISNVSGKWVKPGEATDAGYWRRQLRECVRFSEGVTELVEAGAEIMVEVGPGKTLSSLAKMQKKESRAAWTIATMRHPQEVREDGEYLTGAIGRLWAAGGEIDWERYYEGERRRRVSLPVYPFERQRYWIEARRRTEESRGRKTGGKVEDVSKWFYLPGWQRRERPRRLEPAGTTDKEKKTYLVMEGRGNLSRNVVEKLRTESAEVITARAGAGYRKIGEREYEIRAGEKQDYERLLKALIEAGATALDVLHLWSIGAGEDREREAPPEARFKREQQRGFYSLLYLAQVVETGGIQGPVRVNYVSRNVQKVESADSVAAERATALGACKVINQECERIKCRSIDLEGVKDSDPERSAPMAVEQLIDEIKIWDRELEVAYRGRWRYVRRYEALSVERQDTDTVFRSGGVYLITGGTGRLGIEVAEYLCRERAGKVVLVSRGGLDGIAEEQARRIKDLGDRLLVERGDVGEEVAMRRVVERVERKFGRIDGLIHAAGFAGEQAVKLIPEVTIADCEHHFRAKVYGSYVLAEILRDRKLDFCLLFSSNASVLGGLGSICYSAANLFMDALASELGGVTETRWISANWDGWMVNNDNRLSASFQTSLDQYAMTRDEALEGLEYVLSPQVEGQIVVSTGDLESRLAIWIGQDAGLSANSNSDPTPSSTLHARPLLATDYVPAGSEIEQIIVNVWQEVLGIDRLGIHDNFFDLGGNSLIGLKVISRLKKELNLEIPVVALFEGPTVSALAKVISRGQAAEPAHAVSRNRGERRREKMQLKRSASDEIGAGGKTST
ncbi:MAG TPA: SDR family NAD(P)-dependent oxidoreductase [Blastocatellia bacterium]|nr:SDR family NAD(P)-dependent oxidoreductase [Blastocatellia bacterium]